MALRSLEPAAALRVEPPEGQGEPSDDDLIARFAAGHHASFDLLVARWAARVREYLARLVAERSAADDLLQDVLVQVFRSAATRPREQRFAVWLFCVARHAAISHERHREVQGRLLAALSSGCHALLARFQRRPSLAPPQQLEAREFELALDRALRELPEEFRSVFLLREREGLTYEEIGEVVGVPAKTVSTRLVRARAKLRRELAAFLEDVP